MADANYVEALIEAAIYNHYPPIATPSEFKRVFARALSEYEAFKGTPAEKAVAAVKYAIWVIPRDEPKYDNAMIKAEIDKHFPTIAKGSEFKAVYDKALELFYERTSESAYYAVKAAINIVCPDKCQPVTPTRAKLISDVIEERWPLNTLSTTNELRIAYRARTIFNEFAGSGRDKAVKAVEHAHKELVDDLAAKIDLVTKPDVDYLISDAVSEHPRQTFWTVKQEGDLCKLAKTNFLRYAGTPSEKATQAVSEAAIILGLSK
jgi:hypothetical protein